MDVMTKEYNPEVGEEPSFGFSVRPLFDPKEVHSRFDGPDVVDCGGGCGCQCGACTGGCTTGGGCAIGCTVGTEPWFPPEDP
jgi:hypothetical protein